MEAYQEVKEIIQNYLLLKSASLDELFFKRSSFFLVLGLLPNKSSQNWEISYNLENFEKSMKFLI